MARSLPISFLTRSHESFRHSHSSLGLIEHVSMRGYNRKFAGLNYEEAGSEKTAVCNFKIF